MDLTVYFQAFFAALAAYLLVSSASLISEKVGIVNISLEGTMIMGATTYIWMMHSGGANLYNVMGPSSVFVAALIAGLMGIVFGLLLGVTTITFMGDQVVVGTAINLLAPVLFIIISYGVTGVAGQMEWAVGIDQMIPWFSAWILGIVFIIIFIAWIILKKTSYGLRLETSGENPYALETAGISVNKTRYLVLAIAGFLAGLSGGIFMMPGFLFTGTMYGAGFIAIAIVIFGQWRVSGIVIGSILIAGLISFIDVGLIYYEIVETYSYLFQMIPFILPIVVLIFIKSRGAPKSLGKPFSKSSRD